MKKHLKRALSLALALVMVLGMLPLNVLAVELMDTEDAPGRVEIPVIDGTDPVVDAQANDFTEVERPEVPVDPPDEDPDPGEVLWNDLDLTLSFTYDASGNASYVVDIASSHAGATSGPWALAVIPELNTTGNAKPSEAVNNGDINYGDTSADELSDAIATNVALPSGCYVVHSGNAFTFKDDGSYQLTGPMPAGFDAMLDGLRAEGSGVEGTASLNAVTGIPFTVILATQQNPPGVNIGSGVYKPAAEPDAVLGVPNGIVFTADDAGVTTSRTAPVNNLEVTGKARTPIDVRSISWSGTGDIQASGALPNDLQPDATGNINLSISWVDQTTFADITNITGTITVDYDVVDSTGAVIAKKTATIPVWTEVTVDGWTVTATPIEVEVWIGGATETGKSTFNNGDSDSSLGAYIFFSSYDNINDPDTVGGNTSAWPAEGVSGFTEEGAPTVTPIILEQDNTDGVAGGVATEFSVISVEAGSKTGTYTGSITVGVADPDNSGCSTYVMIPITVVVKAPQSKAVYHLNTSNTNNTASGAKLAEYTGPALSLATQPANPTRGGGYTFLGWNTDPSATTPLPDEQIVYGKEKIPSTTPPTFDDAHYFAVWQQPDVTTGDADVTILQDGEPFTGLGSSLPSTSVTLDGTTTLTEDGTNPGHYKATGLATGSYNVFVNGQDTNVSVSVTAGGTGSATVKYWTVKVSTDDHGSATMKADKTVSSASAVTETATDTTGKSLVVLDGTKVEWKYGTASTGYIKDKWASGETGDTITMDSVTQTQEKKALFKKIEYTVKFANANTSATMDPAAGSGVLADKTGLTMGDAVPLPTAVTDSTGAYKFLGWHTNSAASSPLANYSVDPGDANASNEITLYAVWQEKVTVTFDPNGGAWGSDSDPKELSDVPGETLTKPNNPNRAGYTFKYWSTDGSTEATVPGTFPNADTTYTAVWQAVDYTITYYWNKTAGDTSTVKVVSPVHYGDPLNTQKPDDPTRNGYTFAGWFTEAAGTNAVNFGGTVTGNHNFYAKWTTDDVTVTFKANGGKFSNNTDTATVAGQPGASLTPPNQPTRDHYTFDGWHTAETGGDPIGNAPKFPEAGNNSVVYYAHWTPINKTVTYHANATGGSIAAGDASETMLEGTEITVKAGTIVTGLTNKWVFNGWNESADGTGTDRAVGDKLNLNADLDLYAKWNVVIDFDVNSPGTGTPTAVASQTIAKGGKLTSVPSTSLAGYTFTGWSTTQNGSVDVTANTTFDAPATLYAVWTTDPTKIIFDWNYAEASPKTVEKTGAAGTTVASGDIPTAPTRAGYTFSGKWYSEDSCENVVTPAYPAAGEGPTTVYAGWTAIDYTITFDENHDGGSTSTVTKHYNDPVAKPSTDPSWTGHNFLGWFDAAENGNEIDFETYKVTDDDTFYAHWEQITFTVTYEDGDHGEVTGTKSQTINYGSDYTVGTGITAKTGEAGWRFKGWKDGSNTDRADGYKFENVQANITLTAQWEQIDYTVTYDLQYTPDGGTNTYHQVTNAHYGDKFSTTKPGTDPSRGGYEFKGWYTDTAGTTAVDFDATVTGDVTFYAKWEGLTYDVTYVANGHGTITGTNPAKVNWGDTHVVGTGITLTPADDHWVFTGWQQDDSTIRENGDSIADIKAPITLTAQWKERYKVTVLSDNINNGTVDNISGATAVTGGYTTWVDKDSTLAVSATPKTGMRVDAWTVDPDGSATLSATTGTSTTITPSADTTVTVSWVNDWFTGTITLVKSDSSAYTESLASNVYISLVDVTTGEGVIKQDQVNTGFATSPNGASSTPQITDGANGTTGDGIWGSGTLANGHTYQVYVNDYDTGMTIANADGARDVTVTMYKISTEVHVDGAAANNENAHKSRIKGDKGPNTNTGNDLTEFYVPAGAAPVVTMTASAAANSGVRLNKAGDDPKLWVSDVTGTYSNQDASGSTLTYSAMSGDAVITANFTSVYNLKLTAGTGGTVGMLTVNGVSDTSNPGKVDHGKNATFNATPTAPGSFFDYGFSGWAIDKTTDATNYGNGAGTFGSDENAASNSFTPTANTELKASFKGLKATGLANSAPSEAAWDAADGLTITVKAGYTGTYATAITLTNDAGADTSNTLAATLTSDDGAFNTTATLAATTIAAGGSTTVTVQLGSTPLAIGRYTASLTVAEDGTTDDLTITIPLKLVVGAPEEFAAEIKTFPDGLPTSGNPSGTNIQTVYLVSTGAPAGKKIISTTGSNGVWSASGLDWDSTYTVYVNGYATAATVDKTQVAGGASKATCDVTDLYTVQWTAGSYDGGTPTGTSVVAGALSGTINAGYDVGPGKALVVAANGVVTLTAGTKTSPQYKFTGWKKDTAATGEDNAAGGGFSAPTAASSNYTAPAGVPNYGGTAKIFLRPTYVRQYKVTLGAPTPDAGTSSAKFGGTAKTNGQFVWVDAGSSVSITDLTRNDPDLYVFKEWTQDQTDAAAGTFGSANAENTTFAPNADTVVTPNYYKKPTLLPATLTYNITMATGTGNPLPEYTWTGYDAAHGSDADVAGEATVTADTDANTRTYAFTEAYLKTLAPGTYKVTVKSTTGGQNTDLQADLVIEATVSELLSVEIQVEDGNGDTANVADTNRDLVEYKAHTPDPAILKNNKLEYQWYYSDTVPEAKPYDDRAAAEAAVTGTKIGSVTTDDHVDATNPDYKGKYIFAVVEASVTGKGAVVTNAIPVDYDAVVNVTKDGTGIAEADKTKYQVWLVPDTADASLTTKPAGTVEAAWSEAGKYKTDPNTLTGGVEYTVFVNKVEGDTTLYLNTGITVSTQTDDAGTVEFFSVVQQDTYLKHATDDASVSVGESFGTSDADKPGIEVTTAGAGTDAITIASGFGLLKGEDFTAKTDDDQWTQDYHVDWGSQTSNPGSGKLGSYTETKQAKAAAKSDGHTFTNLADKTWVGAQLDQNLYTVTGNVWAYTTTAKIEGVGTDGPVLTRKNGAQTYTFAATGTGNNGHKAAVTFSAKVPKGNYDVAATAATGSSIIKYVPWQDPATATNESVKSASALSAGGVTVGTADNTQAFTIVIDASTYVLKVEDTEATPNSVEAKNKETKSTGTTWNEDYAKYTGTREYTVKVTNTGNTTLAVDLTILRGADPIFTTDSGTTVAPADALTGDFKDSNGMTFGGLDGLTTFTLEPEESKTFTLTIPEGLEVANAADYTFNFPSTAQDGSGNGPTVSYVLKEKLDPLAVTSISTTRSGDTFTPAELKLDNDTPPAGTESEVVYEWYAVPYGTEVTLDETTGKLKVDGAEQTPITDGVDAGGKYTIHANHQGKSIYLVARGNGDGNVIKAAKTEPPVVSPPYNMTILVKENNDAVSDTNAGNYTVYLVPDGTEPDFTASLTDQGIITAAHQSGGEGKWLAAGLQSSVDSYHIYTNTVGGSTAAFRDSGVTVALSDFNDNAEPTVTYHDLVIEDTAIDNGAYDTAITEDTDAFLKSTRDEGDQYKAPTAAVSGIDVAKGDNKEVNKWVQDGTEVTITYPDLNGRDYTKTCPATVTVSDPATKVESKLELKLYAVEVHVVGSGSVDSISLTGVDAVSVITATENAAPIAAGSHATFSLPKGGYNLTATPTNGTTREGYRDGHNDTSAATSTTDPHSVTIAAAAKYDVLVVTTGLKLKLTDAYGTTTPVSGTASYSTSATNATPTRTVTLPYGYDEATVTLTVENISDNDAALLNVTRTDNLATKVTATDWTPINSMAFGATETSTLTIAQGLGVGTHSSTVEYAFDNGNGESAKITYTLKVVVEPTKFKTVSVKDDDGNKVSGSADVLKLGSALTLNDWETVEKNLYGKTSSDPSYLTENDDYTYQWYAGPADKTAKVTAWSSIDGSVTVSDADPITDATDSTLAAATVAGYAGKHVYLVIKAVNGKNVVNAAISEPVKIGFQPVVKVSADHVLATAGTGYVAQLTDGTTTYNTKWNDEKGGFVPVNASSEEISIPGGTYTVKVGAYKGAAAATVALTDTVSVASPTVTANYFTVNAVTMKDFEAIENLGESFTALPTPVFSVGGNAIADKTPVLKGQSVVAKAAAAWTEDYKLTWYKALDTNTTGTDAAPTADNAYKDDAPTMTAVGSAQVPADAAATGSGALEVSETLYVGGRLDQNKYTVNVAVDGTEGTITAIAVTSTAGYSKTETGTYADGNSVDFTVVAGTYTITPTEGADTVISAMSWEGTKEEGVKVLTDKTVAKDPTKTTYKAIIHLTKSDIKLQVDETVTPKTVTSGVGDFASGTNSVVRYFGHIADDGAPVDFPLTLSNPGNTDLSVSMKAFYFSAADKANLTSTYFATPANWADGSAVTSGSNGGGVTWTGTISDNTTLAAGTTGDDAVAAGTVSVDPNADHVDGGAFVFRFVGVTPDNSNTVVAYYVLDLTVKQEPIVAVTTKAVTGMPGTGDKLEADTVTVAYSDDKTKTELFSASKLTTNDVHYAWVSVPAGTTGDVLSKFAVDTADGALKTSQTGYSVLDANNAAYTLTDNDLNRDVYLIAYAPNSTATKTNAAEMAISGVIKTQRYAEITVTVDGTQSGNEADSDPSDGVDTSKTYKIVLEDPDGNKVEATWDATAKVYKAPIDVAKTYKIYASEYVNAASEADSTVTVGGGADKTTATVPYWTVNYTTDVPVENDTVDGLTAYLAESQTQTGALKVYYGADDSTQLATGTPVLEGMKVHAAVTSTDWKGKANYHTLSTTDWADDASKTSGIAYPTDDDRVDSGDLTVNETNFKDKTLAAALKQALFEVTFQVVDKSTPTSSDTSITAAALSLNTTTHTGITLADITGTLGAAGKNGDTVTFTDVPAGSYVIQATAGTGTVVKGYTWNDAAAAVDVEGDIAVVTDDADKNKHAGNTIQIEAELFQVQWQDNFKPADGTVDAFVDSDGFQKVKGTAPDPDLALTYGYTAADVLEYTVRVYNDGNSDLPDFQIAETDADSSFTADLTAVKHYDAAGNLVVDGDSNAVTRNVTTTGFTLKVGECVEFTVTIPTGKGYKAANYAATFTASSSETITDRAAAGQKAAYEPAYQVKKAVIIRDRVAESAIDAPTTGAAPDTTLDSGTENLYPTGSATAGTPVWTYTDPTDSTEKTMDPATDKFEPGRAYTVTVTYTPGDNYEFDGDTYIPDSGIKGTDTDKPEDAESGDPADNTGYTFLGKPDSDGNTVIKVEGGKLVMSYTFVPTAPKLTLVATSVKADVGTGAGRIERMDVQSDGEVDVYYVLVDATPGDYDGDGDPDTTAAPAAPTAEQIITAATGGTAVQGMVAGKFGKQTVDGALPAGNHVELAGLEDGTDYVVYAAAVMKGTKTDTAAAITAAAASAGTDKDGFTTAYKVTVRLPDDIDPANSSTITAPDTAEGHVDYVQAADTDRSIKAENTIVTNAIKTGSLDVTIKVAAGFEFNGWREVTPDTAKSGKWDPKATAGTVENNMTPYTGKYIPASNAVLEAIFDGIPGLRLFGTPRGNQIDKQYDVNLSILNKDDGGKAVNDGTAALLGDAKLIITPRYNADGTDYDLPALLKAGTAPDKSNFFRLVPGKTYNSSDVETSTWNLSAGDYALMEVFPLSTTGAIPASATDTIRLSAAHAKTHAVNVVNTDGTTAANPDAGADTDPNIQYKPGGENEEPVGVYLGILWVYDEGVGTEGEYERYVAYDQMDLKIEVVDEGWVGQPLDHEWDLNPRANGNWGTLDSENNPTLDAGIPMLNKAWTMSKINPAGYEKDESRQMWMREGVFGGTKYDWYNMDPKGRLVPNTEYQFSDNADPAYRDFAYGTTELIKLASKDGYNTAYDESTATGDPITAQRKDWVQFALTLYNAENTPSTKFMKLKYIDTRPDVALASLTGNAAVGQTLNATASVTDHDGGPKALPSYQPHDLKTNYKYGDADGVYDVTVRWFRVDPTVTIPTTDDSGNALTKAQQVQWLVEQSAVADSGVVLVQASGQTINGKKPTDGAVADGGTHLKYTVQEADRNKNLYCTIQGDDVFYVGSGISEAKYVGVNVDIRAWRSATTTDVSNTGTYGQFNGGDKATAGKTLSITGPGAVDLGTSQKANNDTYLFIKWDAIRTETATATADGTETDAAHAGVGAFADAATDLVVKHTLNTTLTADTADATYKLKNYTLVAYYDLLPTLSENRTYELYKTGGQDTAPVFNYANNDGGDNTTASNTDATASKVIVVIKPQTGSTFKDGTTAARVLATTGDNAPLTFAAGAGEAAHDGTYTLSADWVEANLTLGSGLVDGVYDVTFYDTVKGQYTAYTDADGGTANAGGKADYDKTVTLTVTAGQVPVTARVEDTVPENETDHTQDLPADYKGNVQVNTETASDTDTAVADGQRIDSTSTGYSTKTGGKFPAVDIKATPKSGYVFDKWVLVKADGTVLTNNAGGSVTYPTTDAAIGTIADATLATTKFTPAVAGATVEARFKPADFAVTGGGDPVPPQPDEPDSSKHPASADAAAQASVFYGDDAFDGTPGALTITGDAPATQKFKVSIAKAQELVDDKILKSGDPMLDTITAATETEETKWFLFGDGQATDNLSSGATVSFKVDAAKYAKSTHVRRLADKTTEVTNELVVYVRVEETNTGAVKYVPYTVDVKTSPLHITDGINAADYASAYTTGEDKDKLAHGDPVLLEYYTFTTVVNDKNHNDVVVLPAEVPAANHNAAETFSNGEWKVETDTFDGYGPNETANDDEHTFTFTYRGEETVTGETIAYANPYDYSFAAEKLTFTVEKPGQMLDFSDVVTPETPEDPQVPAVDTYSDTYSNTKTVVYYLDEIPDTYDVYLRNPGSFTLYDVTLTVPEDGNTAVWHNGVTDTGDQKIGLLDKATAEPITTIPTLDELKNLHNGGEAELVFKADLSKLKFAGDYTLTVKAVGNTVDQGTPGGASLMATNLQAEATYTLVVRIVPRPIVVANVTGLGAPVPETTVADNLENLEVHGYPLNGRPRDEHNAAVPKNPVDLINKIGDTEPSAEGGLDVNGRKRLTETVTWVDSDTGEELGDEDTFKVDTGYGITLILKPDFNYTFIRSTGDNYYNDPVDNDKTPEETGKDKLEGDYKLIVDSGDETNPNKEYPLEPESWTDPETSTNVVIIKEEQDGKIATLMFDDAKQDTAGQPTTDTTGPAVNDKRTITVTTGTKLGKYVINLGAYLDPAKTVDYLNVTADESGMPDKEKDVPVLGEDGKPVTNPDGSPQTQKAPTWTLTPAVGNYNSSTLHDAATDPDQKVTWELDLSGIDTSKPDEHTLVLTAKGIYKKSEFRSEVLTSTYTLTILINNPGGGGGGGGITPTCPNQVSFLLGLYGTTQDPTMEMVATNAKVSKVPAVNAIDGWKFVGWSMTAPTGDVDKDAQRKLEDPKGVTITGDTNFYAVYAPNYDLSERPFHEHYVIGYPNGNFGPTDNINRASVATIIARAVLPNFVEGADYGNPGGYSDVSGHWAASAIAYCSKYGVFNGYTDGTFRPDQSITRQEFALAIARLDGLMTAGTIPFSDIGEAGSWALDGIYTAYAKGWVNGYTDGTFRPLDNIQRDEAVKVFNAYLYRGVDADGLKDLKEYVHTGVASHLTENGTTEYMTWPDVPKGHWAYYEIIEAANDHEYAVDATAPKGYTVPEDWTKCWIDEKWRYHDDLTDGGPTTGLLAAGFRVWSVD